MKNYQKPEAEIVKFTAMESVMDDGPLIGGDTGDGEPGSADVSWD